MTKTLVFLLFFSLAGAQTKGAGWISTEKMPYLKVDSGYTFIFAAPYKFHLDTLRYNLIMWRDKAGLIHADSAYQIRAGMVRERVDEIDNRPKWLFLYDGTLLQERDVIMWYLRQR